LNRGCSTKKLRLKGDFYDRFAFGCTAQRRLLLSRRAGFRPRFRPGFLLRTLVTLGWMLVGEVIHETVFGLKLGITLAALDQRVLSFEVLLETLLGCACFVTLPALESRLRRRLTARRSGLSGGLRSLRRGLGLGLPLDVVFHLEVVVETVLSLESVVALLALPFSSRGDRLARGLSLRFLLFRGGRLSRRLAGTHAPFDLVLGRQVMDEAQLNLEGMLALAAFPRLLLSLRCFLLGWLLSRLRLGFSLILFRGFGLAPSLLSGCGRLASLTCRFSAFLSLDLFDELDGGLFVCCGRFPGSRSRLSLLLRLGFALRPSPPLRSFTGPFTGTPGGVFGPRVTS